MHQHIEAKDLPPLLAFDGNPSCWPEFTENFKIMVHLKTTFNDTIRMERLLSVLRGEGKKSVEYIWRNGIYIYSVFFCRRVQITKICKSYLTLTEYKISSYPYFFVALCNKTLTPTQKRRSFLNGPWIIFQRYKVVKYIFG